MTASEKVVPVVWGSWRGIAGGPRRSEHTDLCSMPRKRLHVTLTLTHFVTSGRLLILSGLEFPHLWEGLG